MAGFEPIWVLGCMSGTSMDGVDCAAILTDGHEVLEFGGSSTIPFSPGDRAAIAAAIGLWPDGDFTVLDRAANVVLQRHIEAVEPFAGTVSLLGFHGQTVNHDPDRGRTFQLGDGAALAQATALQTVWDFRSLDMAQGGQGAPLAPFYHFALARRIGATEPVAFLNLGGVGNVTWVDPSRPAPDDPAALLAFDTGPASALIDDFMQKRRGLSYDKDGALAASGKVDRHVVGKFLTHRYFAQKPPKSLDRNDFAALLSDVQDKSDAEGAATLTAATVASVVQSADWLPSRPSRWLVTGGGRHNRTIMAGLSACLGATVDPVEAVGLDGDILEAQAFGYLAVRRLRRLPTAAPTTTGCRVVTSGGRISLLE